MSQSGILADNTSPSGDVETLTADDANVASPVANNINIFGLNGITTTAAGDTIFVNGINAEAGATEPATQKGVAGYYDGHFTVTTGFVTLLNDTGGAAIQGILTDDGAPAVVADASANVTFIGGTGINITGQAPGSSVTFSLDSTAEFTLTTNDAVPQALATIDAGTTAGVYSLDILIAAYAPPPVSAGGAYSMWGGVRTTGAAATLTGVADIAENEEAALLASDVSLTVSGNDIIVQVTGVAATTINWKALVKYTLVT